MKSEDVSPTPDSGPDAGRTAKKHIRGSTLLLAGRGVGTALNFGVQVLIVRHLAKADYGAFAYAMSLMLFGSHVVGLGLAKGLNRYVPIYQVRGQYDRMAGTVVLALGACAACGLAVILLVAGVMKLAGTALIDDPLALTLVLILICVAPLQALDQMSVKLFAIFASPRALFLRRHVLGPGLKLGAALLLIAFQGGAVFLAVAYLLTGILGTAISLLIIAGVLRKDGLLGHFRPGRLAIPAREVLGYSVPLITSDVVTALRGTLIVLFLGFFHSSVSVAAFRAVLPVARLNVMVFDSFKLLFVPHAARMYAREDWEGINDLYWRTASWIAVVTFPIFAVSFSLATPVTVLLFGERYADSGSILSILSLGLFVNAVFGFNALTLRVFRKVKTIVTIDMSVIGISVLANLLLIPKFGAIGGALASCGVLIIRNVWYQAALSRARAVKPIDWRFVQVSFSAFAVAAGLFVLQSSLQPPVPVSLMLGAIGSLAVLWLNAPVLDVRTTFPELARFAPARRFLRIAED
jgi:O-antigen/teichoic acid export membrane protein